MKQRNNDKVLAWAMAFLYALLVCVVLIIGYIAIFKHRDCVTRQECIEIVDSVLTQIYDWLWQRFHFPVFLRERRRHYGLKEIVTDVINLRELKRRTNILILVAVYSTKSAYNGWVMETNLFLNGHTTQHNVLIVLIGKLIGQRKRRFWKINRWKLTL